MRTTGNALFDKLLAPRMTDNRPFLRTDNGEQVSFGDMADRAQRWAGGLRALGLEPGERIVVQAAKSVECLSLYAAAATAGAVYVPLNTAYTAAEVEYFVDDAAPKLIICDPAAEEALAPIAHKAGARLLTLGANGEGALLRALADANIAPTPAPTPRDPEDLAAILYTSGTTGRSKGAMLSCANLISNSETLAAAWRFSEADILLHALPIFHTHGLFVATNVSLLAGGSMIFMPKFDVDKAIAALPNATAMMGVPTFYTRLLADPRFDRALTKNMRLFVSGSAPLLAETHRQFEARTGHRILERYGMTETNMNTSNPYDGERRAGTVGLALPGVELRVVNPETGAELVDGETGVIEVRGPNVCKGYWRNPEKTAEEMRSDGFFITGDLGYREPDGYVTIVGRAKDLIITGGLNVYPKEIESAIDELPGVAESAVIGAPHPDFGEGVVAIVVAEKDGDQDEKSIIAALAERLAKFKQPKRVLFVNALPRNTMGKVQKQLLRERYNTLLQ
ncbi:MAG: malonyl-CoA synthase [Neomegalonema sp.]|nr:malonyl-CoA synthase [Neomegalonema sp.]